jgi:hypothetical protein
MDWPISSSLDTANLRSTCLVAYCDSIPRCKSPHCTKPQLLINDTTFSAHHVRLCANNVCDAMPAFQVNPDIGGPGPTYSYIIQIAISLSVIIVLSLLFVVIRQTIRLLNRHGLEIDEQKQETRLHATLETLLITLEDFQRAQCCFSIAVNIASAITLRTRSDNLSQGD